MLPGVRLSLTVPLFLSELHALAEQLQGIKLGAVHLRCLRGEFCEASQALLAQCSIERLTVHFVKPGTHLQHKPSLPAGAHVGYCKLDPAIAAGRLRQQWASHFSTLDDLLSFS